MDEIKKIFNIATLKAIKREYPEENFLLEYLVAFFSKQHEEISKSIRLFWFDVNIIASKIPIRLKKGFFNAIQNSTTKGEFFDVVSGMLKQFQGSEIFQEAITLSNCMTVTAHRNNSSGNSKIHSSFSFFRLDNVNRLFERSPGSIITHLSVSYIHIGSNNFFDDKVNSDIFFQALMQLSSLMMLDLSNNMLGTRERNSYKPGEKYTVLEQLGKFLKASETLKELNLSNNCLGDKSFKEIFSLPEEDEPTTPLFDINSSLKKIDLSVNFLTLKFINKPIYRAFGTSLLSKGVTINVSANYTTVVSSDSDDFTLQSHLDGATGNGNWRICLATTTINVESLIQDHLFICPQRWVAITSNKNGHAANLVEAMTATGELSLTLYNFGEAVGKSCKEGTFTINNKEAGEFFEDRQALQYSDWCRTKPEDIQKLHKYYYDRKGKKESLNFLGENCFFKSKEAMSETGEKIKTSTEIPANHLHRGLPEYTRRVSY